MTGILVIDDEPQLRELLRRQLEEAGFAVVTAANGEEGLAVFRRRPVPIVLTDLLMHHGDGLTVIRTLCEAAPATAIIAMTGGNRDFQPNHLMEVATFDGADLLLHKPFTSQELLAAVDRAAAL